MAIPDLCDSSGVLGGRTVLDDEEPLMTTAGDRRGWLVSGRVQGVGFRWSTVQRARQLGLDGAVWNRRDGKVEVHASGDASGLDALESWLQVGPSAARVKGVDPIPASAAADGPGFRARA